MKNRTDQNQKEIVHALKQVGATVEDLSQHGKGCTDLLVGFQLKNYLIEVKNTKTAGKLSKRQKIWHDEWRGQKAVVYTANDALKVIGVII